MWATTEVQQALIRHFHIEAPQAEAVEGVGLLGGDLAQSYSVIQELWDRLGIDGILGITPPYVGPPPRDDGDYWENEWGMGYRAIQYPTGVYNEQVRYPLAEAETIADLVSRPVGLVIMVRVSCSLRCCSRASGNPCVVAAIVDPRFRGDDTV